MYICLFAVWILPISTISCTHTVLIFPLSVNWLQQKWKSWMFSFYQYRACVSSQNWLWKYYLFPTAWKWQNTRKAYMTAGPEEEQAYREHPGVRLLTYNHTGTNYTDRGWLDRIQNELRSPERGVNIRSIQFWQKWKQR